MPSQKAKQRKYLKKQKHQAVKRFKKEKNKRQKIVCVREDGSEFNKYVLKTELSADDR